MDPWRFFQDENHLPWRVRHTVWLQAARWRQEREQEAADPHSGPPKPRSAAEVKEARAEQTEAFEKMLAVVEGRTGGG